MAQQAAKPFQASSFIHKEPFYDFSYNEIIASSQFVGPISVVPYGFLRRVFMQISATGGTIGSGVVNAALPAAQAAVFALQNVDFHDVNGASIIQNLSGWDIYLANRYGNYNQACDLPDAYPYWKASATDNTGVVAGAGTLAGGPGGNGSLIASSAGAVGFTFGMYVPLEVANNGLCALANQDAAAKYQMSLTLAPAQTLWSTAVTNETSVIARIRIFADCWAQPYPQDIFSRPQTMTPPLLGSTQFWTRYQKSPTSGLYTIDLERRGAYIRTLILYLTGGTAINGVFPLDGIDYPDPMTFLWDGQIVRVESVVNRLADQVGAFGQLGFTQPYGVFVYQNSDDTAYGDDNGALWYPTLTSTNMQFQGTYGSVVGTNLTLNVLTNDIAIANLAA
jgi:hypothetical protein